MNIPFIFGNSKLIATSLKEAIANSTQQMTRTLRDSVSSMMFDNNKDYYRVYGWKGYGDIGSDDFWAMAMMNPVAHRITSGVSHDCWANGFEFVAVDGYEEVKLDDLNNQIQIMNRNGLLKALERADTMNRINRYSLIEVVVPDGLSPYQPLGRVGVNAIDQIRLIPYREDGIEVIKWVRDPTDPRNGMPEMYQVQVIASGNDSTDTDLSSHNVHWSRCILLNEGQMDSSFDGESALQAVFNDLVALDKATGGAAEAYYRNAHPKYKFELASPDYKVNLQDPDVRSQLDTKAKNFINDMEGHIFSPGFNVDSINTPHASPLDTVKSIYWRISSKTQMSIRILTGEGAGQLAGSEDKLAYNVMIDDRQNNECKPTIYQFARIMEECGAMAFPAVWDVNFPKEEPTTKEKEAELGKTYSEIFRNLSAGMAPMQGAADEFEFAEAFNELTGLKLTPSNNNSIGETDGDIIDGNPDGSRTD